MNMRAAMCFCMASNLFARIGVAGLCPGAARAPHSIVRPASALLAGGLNRLLESLLMAHQSRSETLPKKVTSVSGHLGQGASVSTWVKTSRAACATAPESSARASAASSMTPPRATLITRAPRLIFANAASPKMPCANLGAGRTAALWNLEMPAWPGMLGLIEFKYMSL